MIAEEDDHTNQIKQIANRKESSFFQVRAEITEKQTTDKKGE